MGQGHAGEPFRDETLEEGLGLRWTGLVRGREVALFGDGRRTEQEDFRFEDGLGTVAQ